ncbi:MAG: hypothetical protein AB8G26_05445 [Ilumatobacter sp.]
MFVIGTSRTIEEDAIVVSVPLRSEHGSMLRVIVSSLGADAGFSVDEIDDLKLAVSEVFTLLVEGASSVDATHAHAEFRPSTESVELCLHRGVEGDDLELDVLASTILSSVVDSHRIDGQGVTMLKRRQA